MEIVGTQNDFLKFKDEIVHYLLKVQNKMDEVVKNMLTKADKQEIINRMDTFAQRSEDHDNKVLFHNHRINDLEVKTTDHESRLTRLESK
ncbi:MAG: hypothetical protein A2901_03785 [Elusimicrobia bacterium RIFCSPLOWO2_01_FULL_54_10]|nr:MAG: hypothetical protein A2901_03785 [Elusimicrobia bacterium RIFCSPLOWO2_01_FULL_54_10]